MKNSVPVYIVPVEQSKIIETTLPIHIDHNKCKNCMECPPAKICIERAIINGPRIDLIKCTQCGKCVEVCPFEAITKNKKIKILARKIDLDNLNKLKNFENVVVLQHPEKIFEAIFKLG